MKYNLVEGFPLHLEFCNYEKSYKKYVSSDRPPSFYAFESPPSFFDLSLNIVDLSFFEKDVIFEEGQDCIKVKVS